MRFPDKVEKTMRLTRKVLSAAAAVATGQKRILLSSLAVVIIILGVIEIWRVNVRADAPVSETGSVETGSAPESPLAEGSDNRVKGKASATATAAVTVPRPTLSFDVSVLKRGELELGLTVSPECVHHGQTITAVLTAVPGAYVSLIVGYADGQSYGTWYAGPVAPDGTLTFPWTVPSPAATGPGTIFAAGHDPVTERSGTAAATFRVEELGKC